MSNPHQASASIGFLTVCEHEGSLFGGYLLLNVSGRPLEFHCTAPVRPTRTQAILYGPTLKPYLYGEQIGQTLLGKGKAQPLVVFTDTPPVLSVRDFVSLPVAYVPGAEKVPDAAAPESAAQTLRLDAAHPGTPAPFSARLHRFSVGERELAVLDRHAADEAEIVRRWQPYSAEFDVFEPFSRVREAIDEARRSVK